MIHQTQGHIRQRSYNYTPDARIIATQRYDSRTERLRVIAEIPERLSSDYLLKFQDKQVHFSLRSRIGRKGINGFVIKDPYWTDGKLGVELDLQCVVQEYKEKVPVWYRAFEEGIHLGKFYIKGRQLSPDAIRQFLGQKPGREFSSVPYINIDPNAKMGKDGLVYVPLQQKVFLPSDSYTLEVLAEILRTKQGRQIIGNYRMEKLVDKLVVPPKQGLLTEIMYDSNIESNVESSDVPGVFNFISSYTRDGERKLVIEAYNSTSRPQEIKSIGLRFLFPDAVPRNGFFAEMARKYR